MNLEFIFLILKMEMFMRMFPKFLNLCWTNLEFIFLILKMEMFMRMFPKFLNLCWKMMRICVQYTNPHHFPFSQCPSCKEIGTLSEKFTNFNFISEEKCEHCTYLWEDVTAPMSKTIMTANHKERCWSTFWFVKLIVNIFIGYSITYMLYKDELFWLWTWKWRTK